MEKVYSHKNFFSTLGKIVSLWTNFGYPDSAMDEEIHLLDISVKDAFELIAHLELRVLVISDRLHFLAFLDKLSLKVDKFYVYLLNHLRARNPSDSRLWLQYNTAYMQLQ